MKSSCDIIISINVHHKPIFLFDQLNNIKAFVKLNYVVILNCNKYMYHELKNNYTLDSNIIVNDTCIDKKRFHGTLMQGIVSNMMLALNNYNFKYFISMSLRCRFYKELNENSDIISNTEFFDLKDKIYNKQIWHWPIFSRSKLYQDIMNQNKYLCKSPHEGLCFNEKCCIFLVSFLKENLIIATDILNFNWCVEEFALQTICANYNEFYYLGNGTVTKNISDCSQNRFIHKIVDM